MFPTSPPGNFFCRDGVNNAKTPHTESYLLHLGQSARIHMMGDMTAKRAKLRSGKKNEWQDLKETWVGEQWLKAGDPNETKHMSCQGVNVHCMLIDSQTVFFLVRIALFLCLYARN
jgi:hypothetical protein